MACWILHSIFWMPVKQSGFQIVRSINHLFCFSLKHQTKFKNLYLSSPLPLKFMNFFQSVRLSQTVTSPYQTITCYAMPWLCLKQHVLHMGLKHASREKKCSMVIFFIFVHKNVYRIRFQKIKIGPWKGFEKKAFFSLLLMRTTFWWSKVVSE